MMRKGTAIGRLARRGVWRVACGVNLVGNGSSTTAVLVDRVREQLPPGIELFEHFLYIGTTVAFISALPLVAFPRVLSLGFAQNGLATSLLYLAFSLSGVFIGAYQIPMYLTPLVMLRMYRVVSDR